MSIHQIGWNRSYRQALELLIKNGALNVGRDLAKSRTLQAQMEFVAQLFSVMEIDEVKADLAAFRQLLIAEERNNSCNVR